VKVLPLDKSTPEAIANFTREIRALARLDHPRLVGALDAGEDGSVHYLVTEYVPGVDLRKLVRREGPLDMATAASIICQVAEGLEYAHSEGIVHRDVKPGNVLVSPQGVAKLSDLGLSGPLAGHDETDPRHGKIVGTADYLSPDEVRDPWHPTPAWDIYSLGCTLYYAVTGKVPFPGGTTADKARAHCDLRPLDPRRLNPHLSPDFVDVMADMMAKDPSERIGSAREVIGRLAPFLPSRVGSAAMTFAATAPPVSQRVVAPPLPAARRKTSAVALADTQTDFAGASAAVSDESSSSSVVLETLGPSTGVRRDSAPRLERPTDEPRDLMAVLWPLTVFVLAPLALIGAVSLLLLLVRAVM
jgi:eukaryotic-like serine/threonine-protein kinase